MLSSLVGLAVALRGLSWLSDHQSFGWLLDLQLFCDHLSSSAQLPLCHSQLPLPDALTARVGLGPIELGCREL